jgi:RNA polymerase sigma-70 factor (ECF subfamily)
MEHRPAIERVAMSILRNRADAEDVVQETYLKAARCGGYDAAKGSLGVWLCTVGRRVALDFYRARQRREARDEEAAHEEPKERAGAQPDVDLRCLDERVRRAVEGYYLEGCAVEALADREGVPVTTIRARIARGRSRLRAVYAAHEK